MKNVIIVPNSKKDSGLEVTKKVVKKLRSIGFDVFAERTFEQLGACGAKLYEESPTEAELIIVVGGDGSIIDASRLAISMDIPMLGINLGRVGYLSEVEPDALDVLERLALGDYNIEQKMLLSVDKYSPIGDHESSGRNAVNDVVISHDAYFGIAEFKLENSYGDRILYRADGLILSTPAGSTA